MVPTNCPVMLLKALMVPVLVLLETRSVLLSGPKFLGDGQAPGLVQRCAMCHLLQECSIFAEDVDVAPRRSGGTRERNLDQPSEVLDAEGSEPRRKRLVRKRLDQFEFAVINVNFVVRIIGREKKIPGGPAGDGQAGVNRPRSSRRNDGVVGVGLRRPSADGPVQGRKKED